MKRFWLSTSVSALMAGLVALTAQDQSPQLAATTHLSVGSVQTSELREWDAQIDRLLRAGDLVRRSVRDDTVTRDGRFHERYDQYFNGVRVFGGQVVRQQHRGETRSLHGTLHGGVTLDTEPRVDEAGAVAFFEKLTDRPLHANARPELVVLPIEGNGYALAWRTHVWTAEGWMHTFIDAHDGRTLLQYNDLQTQAAVGTGTGVLGDSKKISTLSMSGRFAADDQLRPPTLVTYDMQGNLRRAEALLFLGVAPTLNDVAHDGDNIWTDTANVDAHVHLGWTYDYLFKRFGRRGLDDQNSPIRAITHPVRRNDIFTASNEVFGTYYLNAFWCGACGSDRRGMMMFGEGLPGGTFLIPGGQYYDYFAGALDIVAHELAHGVTSYSSGLIYRNESGALNEAFSDIVGTSVEFFFHPPGAGQRRADYLIGEDISRPGGDRSMADPAMFGDPDHYGKRYLGAADNGGVHINSGIANHAFYLAIEGGTNRTSGLTVQGVGAANREQIEKVFYRAFVFMLTPNATFSRARAATIQAARDLYGANSPAERAVTQAWTAVGVS